MNELFLIVIIQICLESLPVSSSGHLMLISMLCQVVNRYSFALPEHFDHFLHGPTLIVLGIFFFSSWWLMFKTIARSFVLWLRGKKISSSHRGALMIYARIVGWVMCADVVTVFMYGVKKVLIKKNFFIVPTDVLLLVGLYVTMMVMLTLWLFERKKNAGFRGLARNDKGLRSKFITFLRIDNFLRCNDSINYNDASTSNCHPGQVSPRRSDLAKAGPGIQDNSRTFGRRMHCVHCSQFSVAIILGFIQGFALIPGISRFASTFVGARLLGMTPRRAFATSFAMLAPLACAGFLFNGVCELIAHPEWLQLFTPGLLVTMACSTVVAYALFVFSYHLACAQRLWWFGWYMMVPVATLVAFLFFR